MNLSDKLRDWVATATVLVIFFFAMFVVGEVYRKFRNFWLGLWIILPVLAYFVASHRIDSYLTVKGFKSLRLCLMIFAVGISFIVFFDNDLKEVFGHHFIKGSKFWYGDYGDTDDYGRSVASHKYYAPTAFGRFILWAYDWIILGLCVFVPYIIHKSFEGPCRGKDQEHLKKE